MLTAKAKYALRAMALLAQQGERMITIPDIAKRCKIPRKFLETILQDLKKKGLLASKRGVMGGYYLERPPEAIMLGAIVRAIDGPLAPIRCASVTSYVPCSDCDDVENCKIRKAMCDVRSAIADVLDNKPLTVLYADGDSDMYHI
jgi:Rrf2 family protein